MPLARIVQWGAWLMIVLNLLMAFGSIWVFTRMAPAIEGIIARNERSLQACEEMLVALAQEPDNVVENIRRATVFNAALKRARNNVTEAAEPAAISAIEVNSPGVFRGDKAAREKTVASIARLAKINREAMVQADFRAQRLGYAGAWGVVFMATCVFFAGIIFKRKIHRSVLRPLEEIHDVISARRSGDVFRRCVAADAPNDVAFVFNGVNELLDAIDIDKPRET